MKTHLLEVYPQYDTFIIGVHISFLRWALMTDITFWLTDKPIFAICLAPGDANPDARLWHEWAHALPRIVPRRLAVRIYNKYNPWTRMHQEEWRRMRKTGELERIRMD